MCMRVRIIQEREETDDAEGREKGQWGWEFLNVIEGCGVERTGGGLALGRSREVPSEEGGGSGE